MKRFLELSALAALLFSMACHHGRSLGPLVVWVPGGGAPAQRVQELAAEMGIPATFIGDQEAVALRGSDLQGVRALVCFDGPGSEGLLGTDIPRARPDGMALLLAGPSAAAYAPLLRVQAESSLQDAQLRWTGPALTQLQPGTFAADGTALLYGYPMKELPGWRWSGPQGEVWAVDSEGLPRWEEFAPKGGHVVLAGLPLAREAASGDGAQARLLLARAAELAGVARLWPTPGGQGVVIVNIHVDSDSALPYLPTLMARWPARVRGTFHITAGPDCNRIGDGDGFDVGNEAKGKPWMARLATLGEIGSHGGWAHNLWSKEAAGWTEARREEFLAKNSEALQPWGPITSYSSPDGLQPRAINPWLEAHGMRAYYHTGEQGCPPTRAWLDGSPFAGRMWAFPVAALGPGAGTSEFKAAGVAEPQVAAWQQALLAFCAQRRECRLIYAHPVDLTDMPNAYYGCIDSLDQACAQGRLASTTMSAYAAFLDRRQQLRWAFEDQGAKGRLKAEGASLESMSFRLPGPWKAAAEPGLELRQAEGDTWVVVLDKREKLALDLVR